ncbi:PREDICTED: uncharacterized protein LOC109185076 [Ipomoea nil]|uniref:uncharacterized protein LOC109185076 n=1 Tax=Ipomoea nil TaxID=35883 RepID=UPI000900D0AB|nr:PREDICTED: uncharacterized protein LOC109185076 [Ipomoea nil]
MSGPFILGAELHPQLTTKAIKLRCGMFIHVHIPKDIVCKYKNEFKEGQVYGIRNFLCITNFFKYKTSTLRYMIKFKHDTLVKQYKHINFLKTMFRFKSFPAILSKQDVDEKVLMDVIGRVVEIYSPLEKVIAGKKKKRTRLIDFVLKDMSKNPIKCTLWDDHVDQLLPYFNQDVVEPLILLIQLFRAKFMDNGEVRICSSFDAMSVPTKLGVGFPNGSGTSKEVLVSSIEEIYSKKHLGEYWVAGRIVGVESLCDWYFISCKTNSYKRKLSESRGMLYCARCNSYWQERIVRYRVIVRVADETEDAPMLIWDRECADLVGIAAADLKEKYLGGNNSIPMELRRLCGMSMLFRIAMKKDQVESYYPAFTILRVCRDEAVLTQHCSGFLACNQSEIMSADGGLDVSQACECVGLDEIPADLDDRAVAIPLKRCLMKDFDAIGSSKKPKVADLLL